jgi:multidrug transporter EmrE-like cation transporter
LTAISHDQLRTSFRFSHGQSVALVFCCTLLGAAAQILMKSGAGVLSTLNIVAILTNLSLFAGYCQYGASTFLLVLALRDSELSILYPIVSLSYVWVTILSVMIFHETLNFFKVLGISTVVIGVAVLGRNGRR